jgi:hypothetical protein
VDAVVRGAQAGAVAKAAPVAPVVPVVPERKAA